MHAECGGDGDGTSELNGDTNEKKDTYPKTKNNKTKTEKTRFAKSLSD